jgi:D-glycero-D-manno-heptose 1,7-bisphosphate phosphatase
LVLTGRHADLKSKPLPPNFPEQTHVHADLAAFVDQLLGAAAITEPVA